MNIQKLIDQTRDIYDNHEHTTTVMNALDYMEQLAKKEEELRVNAVKKGMQVKLVKSIKDDFGEHVGPSTVTHVFLSLDGMLFELGRFYQGPYMSESSDERLGKILEFEKLCAELFSA